MPGGKVRDFTLGILRKVRENREKTREKPGKNMGSSLENLAKKKHVKHMDTKVWEKLEVSQCFWV